MKKIDQLIQGAIDLLCHSGPGLFPRSLDHAEAAKEAAEAGMRALVLKEQHSFSSPSAYLIKRYLLPDHPIEIFGGLVLNNATGGLSPYTVEAALVMGAKIIWMPTFSSSAHKNHLKHIDKSKLATIPKPKRPMLEEPPLTILDEHNLLLPQVSQICRLIADAGAVLATGHLYKHEIDQLIAEAQRCGVEKILINHPEHIINCTLEEMKHYGEQGVFVEHSYSLIYSKKLTHEYLFEMIKAVGAEHTIIGSDLGQVGRPTPVKGLKSFISHMLDMELSEREIQLVLCENPAKLLDLD